MTGTTATTDTIGTGPRAWFNHIGVALAGMQRAYREALRRRRTRTLILTAIVLFGLLFPIINQYFLEGFSRNVFPLPFPDATVMTFMAIFSIMAVGLNIVVGFAGLLDLGYVAFYAIGAYVAAFLSSPHWAGLGLNLVFLGNVGPHAQGIHLPFWIIVPIAILVVATFGALLGAPTLRLRGDYLAIVTLGFGEIVPLVFKNLSSLTIDFNFGPINIALNNVNLTGGVQGINPIDPPFLPFLNILFDSRSGPLAVYLGIFLLAVTILIARNLEHSRIGRAWMAIREDETAAEMMGVNTVRTKLLAFALGASAAGIAGAFQAAYLGATTSDFFEFSTSILVLIMIILGGIGNIWGVIVGAITLVYVNATLLPYLGQRVQDSALPLPNPAQYNFLLYGIILLVMMRFRPQGFLPNRQRVAELSVVGVEAAEAEMVEAAAEAEAEAGSDTHAAAAELPTSQALGDPGLTPPGQDATGPDARTPEVPGEGHDL